MRNAALLLCLALLAAPLAAGVVYEIEVTDHDASPPRTETTEAAVEGRRLKMGVAAPGGRGGKGRAIFDGERREMIVVDDESKSFFVVDKEAFEAIGAMAGQMNAAVQEALRNVPADQRAMVEKMMKERMGTPSAPPARPTSELRATGERAEHAGYPCVRYDVYRGSEKVQELWVTDWSNLEGGAEVVEVFGDMADFFREMMESFNEATGGAMPGGLEGTAFVHMRELDGFPVVTRDFRNGKLEEEATLRSATRRTLDPAEFEPPSGYKRQQMFGPSR